VGHEPLLVRPPYGAVPRRVARLAGKMSFGPVVMWSIDPADWNRQSPEPIVEHVLERLQPGAIIDLHDGIPPTSNGVPTRQATVDAVARLLPLLRERGYRLVTVSQLLAAS
jgi:peptidoglycan/xylan/chitin deacetylase (PgdA/CDA1 family)